MKAKDFDKAFDEGENISQSVDWSKASRPGRKTQRINIDFPEWMVTDLDNDAERLGVARQAIVKTWIADRLDEKKREQNNQR